MINECWICRLCVVKLQKELCLNYNLKGCYRSSLALVIPSDKQLTLGHREEAAVVWRSAYSHWHTPNSCPLWFGGGWSPTVHMVHYAFPQRDTAICALLLEAIKNPREKKNAQDPITIPGTLLYNIEIQKSKLSL